MADQLDVQPEHLLPDMTQAQRETYEILLSEVEALEVQVDPTDLPGTPWLIFEGQGQDGPTVGYIKPNGDVSWLTAG